jgi:hypothetical protein
MRIVLDSTLNRVPPYSAFTMDCLPDFAKNLVYKCKVPSVIAYHGGEFNTKMEGVQPGWLGLLAEAYSRHEKVRIAPHDLWFIVMTELAREVMRAPETYRTLFTSSTEKQLITVPTGDITTISVERLVEELESKVLVPVQLFIPGLSTASSDVYAALCATFCDMVQSYYNYGTFCCGIPEIEVTGTPEDWAMLAANCGTIKDLFHRVDAPANVTDYMARVGRLFTHITGDVATGEPDMEFWKGIFTAKNVGSGGQLQITGWVKDLYLEKRLDSKIENFTHSVGVVPYFNLETQRKFTAIYGAFGVLRSPEGFIYSSYDHVIVERSA